MDYKDEETYRAERAAEEKTHRATEMLVAAAAARFAAESNGATRKLGQDISAELLRRAAVLLGVSK
jgi:hypothetical protein